MVIDNANVQMNAGAAILSILPVTLCQMKPSQYCDWKNITAILAEHETTYIWIDIENRLNQKLTSDSEFQRCTLAEEMHWRGVLERLLAIVQCFWLKTT